MENENLVKQKKAWYKKWWVWAIAIVFVIGMANSGNKDNSKTTSTGESTQPQTSTNNVTPANTQTPKPVQKGKALDLEKFSKIENGMTYDQVKEIIGEEGTVMSEVGEKGSQFYTIAYQYYGKGDMGANANFTFQNGKLQMKAQFGLK